MGPFMGSKYFWMYVVSNGLKFEVYHNRYKLKIPVISIRPCCLEDLDMLMNKNDETTS